MTETYVPTCLSCGRTYPETTLGAGRKGLGMLVAACDDCHGPVSLEALPDRLKGPESVQRRAPDVSHASHNALEASDPEGWADALCDSLDACWVSPLPQAQQSAVRELTMSLIHILDPRHFDRVVHPFTGVVSKSS